MRLGFIAYTLLPAIGLHTTLYYFKIKWSLFWIYIIPILYIIGALAANFVVESKCHDIFVTARNIFLTLTLRWRRSDLVSIPPIILVLF